MVRTRYGNQEYKPAPRVPGAVVATAKPTKKKSQPKPKAKRKGVVLTRAMSKIAKKKKLAAQRRRKKQQDSLSVPTKKFKKVAKKKKGPKKRRNKKARAVVAATQTSPARTAQARRKSPTKSQKRIGSALWQIWPSLWTGSLFSAEGHPGPDKTPKPPAPKTPNRVIRSKTPVAPKKPKKQK